jgi:hypothetical protein
MVWYNDLALPGFTSLDRRGQVGFRAGRSGFPGWSDRRCQNRAHLGTALGFERSVRAKLKRPSKKTTHLTPGLSPFRFADCAKRGDSLPAAVHRVGACDTLAGFNPA